MGKDTIYRQDAIDMLCSKCTVAEPETCSTIQEGDDWCEEVHTLLNMPSAEPKKGKWIEVNDAYNRISGRCSACGWEAHMYEDDVVGMPFCPSCGADMRKARRNG